MHNYDISWTSTIVLTGISLRLITSPTQIFAEKLLAERKFAAHTLRHEILKVQFYLRTFLNHFQGSPS